MPDESGNLQEGSAGLATQVDGSTFPKFSLRAIESAGFLAVSTAIFYFMGYSYYAGFFRTFAFPPPYPELSTSDYFIRAFTSIVTFFSLAITWLDNLSNRFYEPKTYGEAWRVNAPFFLVPVILGAFAYIGGYLNPDVAFWLACILIVGALGTAAKMSIVGTFTRKGSGYGIGAVIMYAATFIYFFQFTFGPWATRTPTGLSKGK